MNLGMVGLISRWVVLVKMLMCNLFRFFFVEFFSWFSVCVICLNFFFSWVVSLLLVVVGEIVWLDWYSNWVDSCFFSCFMVWLVVEGVKLSWIVVVLKLLVCRMVMKICRLENLIWLRRDMNELKLF